MFSLNQLRPRVWHLHFEHRYDLTMHFLRYQEYYDSETFGNTNIQLVDLMDWYSKNTKNGLFTYPNDWDGFNILGKVIFDLNQRGIQDINRYDRMMFSIAELIRSKEENSVDFCIIGTSDTDPELDDTFNHELAHALFVVDEKYKTEATKLVNALPTRSKNFLFKKLKECDYSDELIIDEANAYLSTGLYETFNVRLIKKHTKSFEELFTKYAGKLKR